MVWLGYVRFDLVWQDMLDLLLCGKVVLGLIWSGRFIGFCMVVRLDFMLLGYVRFDLVWLG